MFFDARYSLLRVVIVDAFAAVVVENDGSFRVISTAHRGLGIVLPGGASGVAA